MTAQVETETDDVRLNNLLTDTDKINILKYTEEYLHCDKYPETKSLINDRLIGKSLFEFIFYKLINDFVASTNEYLAENKYTELCPITCDVTNGICDSNIYFISKYKPLFKYSYSRTQIENFIYFLNNRDNILKTAVEYANNIDTMWSETMDLVEEIKEKIRRSNLFKDKRHIEFKLKKNKFSYMLTLNYKYIIINYNMFFKIGRTITAATKYKDISIALKESFLEGTFDSPRQISDNDADVFMRLYNDHIKTNYITYFEINHDEQVNGLLKGNILSAKKAEQFKAFLLLNKLKRIE